MIALVEDADTIFLLADEDKKITIAHSPKNFGGTRNRPTNKIDCFIRMGPQAMCFLLNEKQESLLSKDSKSNPFLCTSYD